MKGPWDRSETPEAEPPQPEVAEAQHLPVTEARVHGTDFLAAQRANRTKTWVLILSLIVIGFLLGYVLGWALEAWGTDAGQFHLFALSGLGLVGGAALAGIGIVSAGVTLAFGDKVVLSMNGAREVTPEQEPKLHNVVGDRRRPAEAAGLRHGERGAERFRHRPLAAEIGDRHHPRPAPDPDPRAAPGRGRA
jgi:heat shock protein HtpX